MTDPTFNTPLSPPSGTSSSFNPQFHATRVLHRSDTPSVPDRNSVSAMSITALNLHFTRLNATPRRISRSPAHGSPSVGTSRTNSTPIVDSHPIGGGNMMFTSVDDNSVVEAPTAAPMLPTVSIPVPTPQQSCLRDVYPENDRISRAIGPITADLKWNGKKHLF